ncbi:hypothetical protein Ahy_A01g004363 isoform D [Arachis hypogaea]|uniref:Uncharacterized protein n=1 Tax=Arachis hypogaea TaxID=3818 RepID=A0A445EVX0_ARAHY|nr:hypothetical protein Ahy_A01g004363 isoform D [Arachis hypogaea]
MKSCLPLTSLLTHSSRILKSESLPFSNPSPSSSHCRRPSVEPLPPSVARIPSPFVLFLKCPTPALSFRELGPSVVFIFSPSCGRCRPSHQRTLPRIPTSKQLLLASITRLGIRLVRLAAAEDGTSFVLVEPCAVDIILAIGRTERRMNGFEGNHPLVTVKY